MARFLTIVLLWATAGEQGWTLNPLSIHNNPELPALWTPHMWVPADAGLAHVHGAVPVPGAACVLTPQACPQARGRTPSPVPCSRRAPGSPGLLS